MWAAVGHLFQLCGLELRLEALSELLWSLSSPGHTELGLQFWYGVSHIEGLLLYPGPVVTSAGG